MSRSRGSFDPLHSDLPVVGQGALSAVRPSRNSRWRALVLLLVHGLIAAHIAHYFAAGRTVSPVEPSEAMYTLELGQLNAGFLFLVAALLLTAVFGRFFCGWGCHLVALQDACAWLMKRIGIRPRPFRSRLLLWGPAALAFYMFAWPTLRRWFEGGSLPPLSDHLLTDAFWKTFPGPLFAVLTFLVCGFAAVYFLGAKGFCTYGCPYGALFAAADKVAPGRILVSDACTQCGHCTATCTSNVLVHDEVRRFGRVVDPGCMKCLDCVSVCPENALRFGFGRPSLFGPKPAKPGPRVYNLSLSEELFVAAVALAATLAFRGLYDGPPLLMAVGLGGITGFVALQLARLSAPGSVRLQNLRLRSGDRMRPAGWFFALSGLAWILFTAHSGYVQAERRLGVRALDRGEMAAARSHLGRADRAGLVPVPQIDYGLALIHRERGEWAAAEERLRRAVARAPEQAPLHDALIRTLAAQGAEGTLAAWGERRRRFGGDAALAFSAGTAMAGRERWGAAVELLEEACRLAPQHGAAWFNLGGALRRQGNPDAALRALERALERSPDDLETLLELGFAAESAGRIERAIEAFEGVVRLDPDHAEARARLAGWTSGGRGEGAQGGAPR
ncbi:hypothetical protein ABI59_01850 [Acidobacteria bacterium Mor1]|nr:hypothetical protein ABI59_01850 [Acidobacteria bacterium Mor1]